MRRVVTVYSATFEGQIHMDDFQGWYLGRMADQGHQASITTLALEAHHKVAPEVSFVHNFPGAVESGIARGSIGWLMRFLKIIYGLLGSWVHIPPEEAGDRHVFFCTSARFSNGSEDDTAGVLLADDLALARGIDGQIGSGVYSIDHNGESAGPKVERLLAQMRSQGLVELVRDNIDSGVKSALASGRDS